MVKYWIPFNEDMGTFFIVGGSAPPEERSLGVKLRQTILLIWFQLSGRLGMKLFGLFC